MNIFEAIREDHEKQRTLVDLLTKTHGDSEGRQELFGRLKTELTAHAEAEERFFYQPLMDRDLTQDKVRHSIAEHHELNELVEELEQTNYSSSGWVATAHKLKEQLLHHLDEEEQEMFQLAGKVLSGGREETLAGDYRSHMKSLTGRD